MDRFEIALKKIRTPNLILTFPATISILKIIKYIKYCHENNYICRANNIIEAYLETAIIKICRQNKLGLVVPTQHICETLSIVHDFKNIYPRDLEARMDLSCHAIFYNCEPLASTKIYCLILSA